MGGRCDVGSCDEGRCDEEGGDDVGRYSLVLPSTLVLMLRGTLGFSPSDGLALADWARASLPASVEGEICATPSEDPAAADVKSEAVFVFVLGRFAGFGSGSGHWGAL